MAEVAAPFTNEQLHGDEVSKKDIATFLQSNASEQVDGIHSSLVEIIFCVDFVFIENDRKLIFWYELIISKIILSKVVLQFWDFIQ